MKLILLAVPLGLLLAGCNPRDNGNNEDAKIQAGERISVYVQGVPSDKCRVLISKMGGDMTPFMARREPCIEVK